MDKLTKLRDFAQALIDEGNRQEREVGKAGAHEAITVRGICERVIADLDAIPVLTEQQARGVVRRACLAVERTAVTAVRIEQLDTIVDRAAKELAGAPVVLDDQERAQLRDLRRERIADDYPAACQAIDRLIGGARS